MVQMTRGERILIGYLPPPDCDIILDYRGANDKEDPYHDKMVASIHCNAENQEILLRIEAASTKVSIDRREVKPSPYEISCPPGSLFSFGSAPHDTSFLVIPAVEPLSQDDYGFEISSTCFLGKGPTPLVPPANMQEENNMMERENSWAWLPKTDAKAQKAVKSSPIVVPSKAVKAKSVGLVIPAKAKGGRRKATN